MIEIWYYIGGPASTPCKVVCPNLDYARISWDALAKHFDMKSTRP